jgi:hypothetical protein
MPFTTLNDEEEKELWRLASLGASMAIRLILTEKWASTSRRWRTIYSANLSWNSVSIAVRFTSPRGGPCGPISEGHGFQAANGEDAYRQRQPLSLCTRDIDPNVGGLGHARLQRTALSNTASRWYSRNRRCPDENAPTLTVSRVGTPIRSSDEASATGDTISAPSS